MFESLKKLFSKLATPPPPQPPAKSVSTSPAQLPTSPPLPVPLQTGDVVHLPLNDILAQLPAKVAPLVLARPGGTFSLPVRSALEQLGTGAVRIRFAQLRQSALPGTFANDSSHDNTLIDLPLPQILAAIGPAAFARRSQQRVIDVPDNVAGVFGPQRARPVTTISPSAPMRTPAPVAPKPAEPAPPTKSAPSIKPVSAAPKAPSPLPFSTRPAPAARAGDEGTLVTTIGAICQSWPESIRQEIEQSDLVGASVLIPINRLEAGMKAGRVVFAWSDLIGWLTAPPSTRSSQGGAELELPLGVIAPLFMEKHRAAAPQKKVSIGQNIPDLFAGLAKSALAAPVATARAAAQAPAQNALGGISGQPSKEDWTPQEITQQIAALPGVSGSLLATADGLLVAGQVPLPLKAETLAAFLPQIFGRMSSYSEEIKLGALRGVTLSFDSAPCAMFKAGALHLAVLGKPGQSLPEARLLQFAAQLAKHNP
jgi:predicted regulator of Ras-like GTPase activity (Roadblock/LC7/MglB family)